ncbi:MAG: lipopolysaccharide biosynthesis protein [Bacteroidales bacterium]
MTTDNLKLKTARTLKWNGLDKIITQVLYAVTGVILANVLSKDDFGLVGVLLIFQAFANVFVDSGFSSALIQKRNATETDFSTVFYFNIAVAVVIYFALYFSAGLIARFFGDERLIDLSRVMFLTFIINSTALVQCSKLAREMNVRMVTISNTIGLVASGVCGITLALTGWGAWAIVWQTVTLAVVKATVLWIWSGWRPTLTFSGTSLRSVVNVGSGVMVTSLLNTMALNLYSFIIGAYYSLASLGVYTQADKWSKMGFTSISHTLVSTFLPLLSGLQGERERLYRAISKANKLSSYLTFFAMGLLFISAENIFHILFGTKWDEAIPLFQILVLRGIFAIFSIIHNNYILAIGRARMLVVAEIVKDVILLLLALFVLGMDIEMLVLMQLVAAAIYFIFTLIQTSRLTGYRVVAMVMDMLPYIAISVVVLVGAYLLGGLVESSLLSLTIQILFSVIAYLGVNALLKSKIQSDIFDYILGGKK